MPKEYVACRESMMKRGISEKTAKARCAIMYFKRHGISVNEAHKRGYASFPDIGKLDQSDMELITLISANLNDIERSAKSTKPDAHGESIEIQAINIDFLDEYNVIEINATKVGAGAFTADGRKVIWTERSLKKTAPSWKFGKVSVNHNGKDYGLILSSDFENGFVKMLVKVNDTLKGWIKKFKEHVGVSVEGMKVVTNKALNIVSAIGTGVTFVFPPEIPVCSQEEGCGIVASDVEDSKYVPPEGGTLPQEGKDILDKVYNKCREKYSKETEEDKTRCSKIAWTAVHKAGFKKGEDGKWVKATVDEPFDLEEFIDENCGCEETETINGIIKGDLVNVFELPLDTADYKWVGNTSALNPDDITYVNLPPNNIGEENKNGNATDNGVEVSSKELSTKKGESMADEKPTETICAKKHESLMKEKDSVIEAKVKEIESLKATVAKFEAERKAKVLEQFVKETGLDAKAYESREVSVLEDIMATVKALKEKEAKEPEVNSGAEVKATEQKDKKEGDIVTATISEAEAKIKAEADELAKKLAETSARATAFDGRKR